MNERLPKNVQSLLEVYVEELNSRLPEDLVEGVYLYGSIALGAFNVAMSDIDFIVLLKRAASEQEVETIKEIHSKMSNQQFGSRMDGVYVQADLAGKTNEELSAYPYCSEGKVSIGHWDVNHITWWVLKEHGITLQGTLIGELNIPTKWEDVLRTLEYNMNEYWFNKTKKIYLFLFDSMVEFAACTISRIICSLERGDILSKEKALILCIDMLPERWHLLLKEGSRIRTKGHTKSLYKSKITRAKDCRDFILYTYQLCNQKFFVKR